jgi:hypothetical protein
MVLAEIALNQADGRLDAVNVVRPNIQVNSALYWAERATAYYQLGAILT